MRTNIYDKAVSVGDTSYFTTRCVTLTASVMRFLVSLQLLNHSLVANIA